MILKGYNYKGKNDAMNYMCTKIDIKLKFSF